MPFSSVLGSAFLPLEAPQRRQRSECSLQEKRVQQRVLRVPSVAPGLLVSRSASFSYFHLGSNRSTRKWFDICSAGTSCPVIGHF